MANIIGTITINQNCIYELDANPMLAATVGLEIGDLCVVNDTQGLWQKIGSGDFDFSRIDLLSSQSSQATMSGTLQLAVTSSNIQTFTGSVSGQVIQLPDATTLGLQWRYEIWNTSSASIVVQDGGGNPLATVQAGVVSILVLADNSSTPGVWNYLLIEPPMGGLSYGTPVSLTPNSGNVQGVSSLLARADHVHNVDNATESISGFMSNTDKIRLDGIVIKAGSVAFGSFSGNPKTAAVTFLTAFGSANYSVSVSGADARAWSIVSKTASGFTINANANSLLTGNVDWEAQLDGEP